MATISSSLQLFDRFSQTLSRAQQGVQALLGVAEKLNQELRQRISLNVDVSGAVSRIDQMRLQIQQQIRSGSSAVSIDVTLGSTNALREAGTLHALLLHRIGAVTVQIQLEAPDAASIRSQLESALRRTASAQVKIQPELDTAHVLTEATTLRSRILAEIGSIRTQIQVQFPSSVTVMMTNLQRLVMRLLTAVRQIGTSSGNTAQLQNELQRIAQLEERINQLQESMNGQMQEGQAAAGGLLGRIKSLAAAYLSFQDVKNLFSFTMGGAMEQIKIEDMFKARTGNAEVGTAMFDKFKNEALAAGQEVTESLKGTLSFFSMTQNTDQLSQLNNLAQRLSAFDLGGNGIVDSASQLKEAMRGDSGSIAERFNIPASDIKASKIDEFGKAGDMDNFIRAFDQLLVKQGMAQEAFEFMMETPANQVEELGNNFKSALADAGGAAVQALVPLISQLNDAFQAGRFQPFFDGLSIGLEWVVSTAVMLFDSFVAVANFFSANWSTIEPILWGIATAMGAYLLATQGVSAAIRIGAFAQWAWNAAMNANPIILIISIVLGLIVWLVRLWQTNDQFAVALMRAWNSILNFFDRIPTYFQIVKNGIVNAFWDMKVKSLEIWDGMVNGVIDSINWLAKQSNKFLGTGFEVINHIDTSSKAAIEAEGVRKAGEEAVAAMKVQDALNAAKREQGVIDMKNNRSAERAAEEAEKAKATAGGNKDDILKNWNSGLGSKLPSIDKVNEVGKISDKVDISDEDIQIMRDLAEMNNIQNFVTLQPSVTFGDTHVRKEADIQTIMYEINRNLEEQFAAGVEGVFAR